jgi:hypothetical protein
MTCGESVKRLVGDASCATWRLNSMLWERCLPMSFILRKLSYQVNSLVACVN